MTAAAKSTKKSAADKEREEAAERTNALAEADATYREDVAKAAAKRQKVLDKYPDQSNLTARAWNATKADEDPDYNGLSLTHKQKLDNAVTAIRETGNADIVGLEDFEAEVKELLAKENIGPSTALAPSESAGRPAEEADSTDKSTKKSGK